MKTNEIIGDIGEEIEIDVDIEVDHDHDNESCVAVAETETVSGSSVANIGLLVTAALVLVFAGAVGGTSYAIVRAVRRSKTQAVGGVDELNLVDSHSPTFVPSYSPTYAPSTSSPSAEPSTEPTPNPTPEPTVSILASLETEEDILESDVGQDRPMNILLLYADDWRYDTLGVAGNPCQDACFGRFVTRRSTFHRKLCDYIDLLGFACVAILGSVSGSA